MELHFYYNAKENLSEVAFSIMPYCKAIFLTDEKNLAKQDKEIIFSLNDKGLRVSTVVLKENERFSLSSVCGLFNFADDFRLIVTTKPKFFEFCLYFATIREIPALIVCKENQINDALILRVGRFLEFGTKGVEVDCARHIFVQGEEVDKSKTFAQGVLNKIAFSEYSLTHVFNNGKNDECFNECKKQLKNSKMKDYRALNLKTALINYRAGGELFDDCAPLVFKRLLNCSCFKAVLYARHLYQQLDLIFKGEKTIIPNYNERVKECVKLFSVDEKNIYQNLKGQMSELDKNTGQTERVFLTIKREIKNALDFLSSSINEYYAMGGKKEILTEQDKKIGDLIADLTEKVNLSTLIRESVGKIC